MAKLLGGSRIYGELTIDTSLSIGTTLLANNVAGTAGQVLTSTGTGIQWAEAATTYTLPAATTTQLGGVKVDGTSIVISNDGVISVDTNTIATKTYVTTQISNLVDSSPETLNTLNELAAALGDDPNFATTVSNQIGLKANSADLATVATTGSYTDLTNKPTLFSGSYDDLTNKPIIPAKTGDLINDAGFITSAALNGYATETYVNTQIANNGGSGFSGDYNDLTNKPTLFSGSYTDLTNKPTLSTVATSGSYTDLIDKPVLFSGDYADLTGKPTLFSGDYLDLTNKPVLFSGSYNDLTNRPTLFSGSYDDLTNKPTIPTVPTNVSAFTNDANYATQTFVTNATSTKQNTLVSGTNIKTINGESLLGSGNITITGGGSGGASTLDELSDVDTTTNPPSNGQVLVYNSLSGKWNPGNIAAGGLYTNTVTLTTTTSNQTVDSFDITEYRTAKYLIQIISGGEVESIEVNLLHTDVGILISQYNRMTSGTELGIFSASIDSNNAYLRFSPANPDTIIDLTRISIIARTLNPLLLLNDLETQTLSTIDLETDSYPTTDLN